MTEQAKDLSPRMAEALEWLEAHAPAHRGDVVSAGFRLETFLALENRGEVDFVLLQPLGLDVAEVYGAWGAGGHFVIADGTRPADYRTNKERWAEFRAAQR